MRFAASADDIKSLAHRLGALTPLLTLSTRLEVLSQTLGYRDWNEAQSSGPRTGVPFPLDGDGTEFLGVLMLEEENPYQRLVIQFHKALNNLVGKAIVQGKDDWSHIWQLSQLLTQIGVTRAGPSMPVSTGVPPAAKKASALYKRLTPDFLSDFVDAGSIDTSSNYAASSGDPREFNTKGFCLDAEVFRIWEAKALTQNSLFRLKRESKLCSGPSFEHTELVRRAHGNVLLLVTTDNSDRVTEPSDPHWQSATVGACLLGVEVECPSAEPIAQVTVTVRACLTQDEEMLNLIGSTMTIKVQAILETLRAAVLGTNIFQIRVRLTGAIRSQNKPAAREREAMRDVLDYIESLCSDELEDILVDSPDDYGLYIEPIASPWRCD